MEDLKLRRTIRKYQQKDISAELLNDLLESACRASTVGNMQVYSVVVTRDAKRKAKLAPAHFNQPMVLEAPVVLTFCIDLHRFSEWCKLRKAQPGYNNFEWFVTGAIDALLVAQTFCVAAEEKGHQVEAEDTDAAPVEPAHDGQDQGDLIHDHGKNLLILVSGA